MEFIMYMYLLCTVVKIKNILVYTFKNILYTFLHCGKLQKIEVNYLW